jgi:inner membrane transporter RhtA
VALIWIREQRPGRTLQSRFAAGRMARAASGALPPEALILGGIVSTQVGAALAKDLFARLSPAGVVTLRLVFAALILLITWRPRLVGHRRTDIAVVAAFGVGLAGMNIAFYEAIARVPLGVAVTVEFLGPLGVAVASSRRRLDLLWVACAGGGVLLLAKGGGVRLDPLGIGFGLVAAVGWACYILLSAATGRRFPGGSGLALAMGLGALISLPFGAVTNGANLLHPELLLVGAGVALLSSVLPYSFEMQALRRIPAGVFGLLMSLEPAVAALIGLALLGQMLAAREWIAVVLVIVACAGATRTKPRPP